jgi:hypothetical protein
MCIKRALVTVLVLLMCTLGALGQVAKVNCKPLTGVFSKGLCTIMENNKAFVVKDQLQKRSGQQSLAGLLKWTRDHYECIRCVDEPGFEGGTLLRKVVYDNALSIAFFLVYDVRVNMNYIEIDGRTLLDWLRDDTEKTFDAAFEAESAGDKLYLMKQLQINQKYYNLFVNNGGKFRHELKIDPIFQEGK